MRSIVWIALGVPAFLGGCQEDSTSMADVDVFAVASRDTDQSPRMMFVAEPPAVTYGEPVNLRWQAPSGDDCVASGGWHGSRAATGNESTQPLHDDTEFLLSCTNGNQASLHKVQVVVRDITPNVEFASAREQVPARGRATLHWHAEGARICRASGGWQGEMPTSGTWETEPLDRSTSFHLTCVSDAGTALASLLVGVLPDSRGRS